MSWNTITGFHISLTASDIDRTSITAFLTENLEGPKDVFDVTGLQASLKNIKALAVDMAKLAPLASFQLTGNCSDDYEYQKFSFEYTGGTLTALITEMEVFEPREIAFEYPDYEEFCEVFRDDDNDCPRYTEEEYEEFCSWDIAFVSSSGQILPDEPDDEDPRRYTTTQYTVDLEPSDDDWDDDEDFEDED